MCSFFDEHSDVFERHVEADIVATAKDGTKDTDSKWLQKHPLAVKSERELVCEIKWRPVFRALYTVRSS